MYLKSEYHASDLLCLHALVSHEYTFITIVLHKNLAKFQQR